MARDGSGVYSLPAGTAAVANTPANSAHVNGRFADLAADANSPRPITAGGTGASSAAGALTNLGITATAAELNALDGVTPTGTALIRAADAAAARTAIGADGEFSLAATGWQRLPSGLIIQWGTQSVSANSTLTGSFPIAFPSACFAFLSSHGIGGNWQNYDSFNVMGGAGAISLTQYQISSFDDLTAPYSWIALGN